MAFPTSVNNMITDSVSQANVEVLGDAPAIAMGNLYQATSQALANAAHNATTAQQQNNVAAQAATFRGKSSAVADSVDPLVVTSSTSWHRWTTMQTATSQSACRVLRGCHTATVPLSPR